MHGRKCWPTPNAVTLQRPFPQLQRFCLGARRAILPPELSRPALSCWRKEEISEGTLIRQAALVDAWLNAYQEGLLALSSDVLPWLRRMHEQCRRRNKRESWLLREKDLSARRVAFNGLKSFCLD